LQVGVAWNRKANTLDRSRRRRIVADQELPVVVWRLNGWQTTWIKAHKSKGAFAGERLPRNFVVELQSGLVDRFSDAIIGTSQLRNVYPKVAEQTENRIAYVARSLHRRGPDVQPLGREVVPVGQKSAICICVAGSHRCVINQEHTFVAADAHADGLRVVGVRGLDVGPVESLSSL
jgi:hypothetical protein